jgi:hypothetical protein
MPAGVLVLLLAFPCAAADLEAGCAVVTTPETLHLAFARGCIARRDFSRPAASAREAATKREPGDAVALPPVEVFGTLEPDAPPGRTLEQRFATTLAQGNPEVAGGKIRHGAFHALGMYWGQDPLTFLYYNVRYGLPELLDGK